MAKLERDWPSTFCTSLLLLQKVSSAEWERGVEKKAQVEAGKKSQFGATQPATTVSLIHMCFYVDNFLIYGKLGGQNIHPASQECET